MGCPRVHVTKTSLIIAKVDAFVDLQAAPQPKENSLMSELVLLHHKYPSLYQNPAKTTSPLTILLMSLPCWVF